MGTNGNEAELETIIRPQRIKDSDKPWAAGAQPTLLIQSTLQEFHTNRLDRTYIFMIA